MSSAIVDVHGVLLDDQKHGMVVSDIRLHYTYFECI